MRRLALLIVALALVAPHGPHRPSSRSRPTRSRIPRVNTVPRPSPTRSHGKTRWLQRSGAAASSREAPEHRLRDFEGQRVTVDASLPSARRRPTQGLAGSWPGCAIRSERRRPVPVCSSRRVTSFGPRSRKARGKHRAHDVRPRDRVRRAALETGGASSRPPAKCACSSSALDAFRAPLRAARISLETAC